ncbi:CDP-glycerol:poly(glycerophosphate) glycerophosphotransferase [compost metagenome]
MNSKIKITLFHLSASGSNNYHLFHAAPEHLRSKYDIELLTKEQTLYNRYLDESDVYITTHGEYLSHYEKVNIDLWHGFPLKTMAKMDRNEKLPDEDIHKHWSEVDMIMSYSTLYNTLMNACNGANISKYQITGMPRNDALFSTHSVQHLKRLFPGLGDGKVIFYMPTFRQSIVTPDKVDGGKHTGNVFGLPDFNKTQLILFLKEHNLSLVLKLHPFEEQYFEKELQELATQGVYTLSDAKLMEASLDLYEVLGAADMLITDYSSVYIDYLLLDRPVLFLATDLEEYRANRGFLLEPYDFWTPGPNLNSQIELFDAIQRFESEPEWYNSERNTILNLCHQFKDDQSSERIWQYIDSYIEAHQDEIYQRRISYQEHKQMQQQVKRVIQGMIEQGHLEQANGAIQKYLENNKADSDIFAMNGMLHLSNNDPQSAIKNFSAGHQHFPWDEDLLYNLGYVHELIGQLKLARQYYEKAAAQCTKPDLAELLRNKLHQLV